MQEIGPTRGEQLPYLLGLNGPLQDDAAGAKITAPLGVDAVAVEHLTHLWAYLRTRPPEFQAFYSVTDAFEHFTSQPPQSLPQFLHEHKDLFAEAG